jgi:hypothetical protein
MNSIKSLFWFLAALVLSMALTFSCARADELPSEVRAVLTYNDHGVERFRATGFNLFMDGAPLCSVALPQIVNDGDVLRMTCTGEVTPGVRTFTLTASWANGASPHSAPFTDYVPPPDAIEPSAPAIVELTVFVNGKPVILRGGN